MTDYYIPLSTILGTLGLQHVPLFGYLEPFVREMQHHIGVRSWRDSWNDTHASVLGTGVLSGPIAFNLGGFGFAFGEQVGETTEFEFELTAPRSSLMQLMLAAGAELAGIGNPEEEEEKLQFFFRSDVLPFSFRIALRGLQWSLQLPESAVKKGQVVNDAEGHPFRIIPVPPEEEGPVEITLGAVTFVADTERGWSIEFDEDELLHTPVPFMIPDTHLGFLAKKIKVDFSDVSGFGEVLSRPGYDETWMGVYIEKLVVFGLDSVFPTVPKMIDPDNEDVQHGLVVELSHWLIGSDGVSGSLRVALNDTGGPLDSLAIEVELDHGNLIRCGGEVTLHGGRVLGDEESFASLGPEGDLLIGFNLRFHPEGGSLVEFVLRTPGTADSGLFTIRKAAPDVVLFAGVVALLATGTVPLGFAAILIPILLRWVDFESITLDALRIRQRFVPLGGREVSILDFVFDVQAKIHLDLPVGMLGLPDIRTDEDQPIGALFRGLTLTWATNADEFTEEELELAGIKELAFTFDMESGVSFEVGNESPVRESPLLITQFGMGRWEQGMWFDVSVKIQGGGYTAFSVNPASIRFWFLAGGDIDHVSIKGVGFSLSIPGVIFCRGMWDVGDVTRVSARALIVATRSAATFEPEKPENWLLDVSVGVRQETIERASGREVSSTIYAASFEHAGGIPTGIFPGTNLYGASGIVGIHARPALGAAGPADWLMNTAPPNVAHNIEKWEGAPGEWGFGFGVVLGSAVDQGRPWNIKAGLLILKPGPVLALHGAVNVFKAAEKVENTSRGAFTFVAVLDFLRRELTLGFRAEKKIPEGSGNILSWSVPIELFVNDQGFHLYFGEHWPPAKHIRAKLLDKFEISGYVMFDTATIANLANTGIDVAGFAIALGVRFDYEGGKKGGRFKLYFVLRAGADLAFSGNDPSLFFIRAFLTGGVVAKAWGIGFELNLSAEFLWIRPTPNLLTGKLKITLDLPWPIPNLKLTIDVSRGNDGPTEELTRAVEGLALIPRDRNTATEFPATGDLTDVPIDPVLSLTFAFTTRNAATIAGSFQPDGANLSTVHATGGDRGYAIEVKSIRLLAHMPGGPVPVGNQIPAQWRQEPLPAAGGEPSRRVLELFTYDGGSERMIGASADYVEWATSEWDPCPPLNEPKPVCYDFEAEELGPIVDERRVRTTGDARILRVAPDEEPEGAESVLRFFGATSVPAEVVQPGIQDSGFVRAIQLPAPRGVADPDAIAAPNLRLAFAVAEEVTLDFLRLAEGTITIQCFRRNELLDAHNDGTHLGWAERKYERVRYRCKGPVDRIDITASYPNAVLLAPAYLSRVCMTYSEDVRDHLDAVENANAFSTFWSNLLNTNAAVSDALLLEPATRYTLEIESSWARVTEGVETPVAAPIRHNFSFVTVPRDRPPLNLRGPEGAAVAGDWDVRTVPAHQQTGVYTERPIRLEFRDARSEAVYGKFGKRLVLRLVDEHGVDLFDRLEFLAGHAHELPEYQRAWRDHLLGLACAPDLESLFVIGSAHFPSILSTDRWYDGTFVLLPDTVTDLAAVDDWDVHPVAYRFRFRTSRWPSLLAHANAYAANVLDEVCDETPDFAALAALSGRQTDAQLLETVLHQHLHLPARAPASRPELVRIWRRAGPAPGDVALLAVLFDGPEAFIRATGSLSVRDSFATAVSFVLIDGESATRSLVLPQGAGGIWSELRFTITDPFTGATGTEVEENATIVLPVPPRPAFLDEEPAP
ncbi:MAG TPA: hypothetical protein VEK57_24015 [Thermoanaerobaculia bacterium]|nr:hypothetical protein [Thermoanaerobaculia bacterium]